MAYRSPLKWFEKLPITQQTFLVFGFAIIGATVTVSVVAVALVSIIAHFVILFLRCLGLC